MLSDHPTGTVAGGAIESFAAALLSRTGGVLKARTGGKSSSAANDLLAAVQGDSVQVAGLFAASLTRLDPIFELSMLPFVADSVDDARRLACVAEPRYRQAFLRDGLHLLFVFPWPPTGLWSRLPVKTADDVATLRVRTYDKASADVLESLGARAAALPVQAVGPLLRSGGLDAVLSSGDGSVGAALSEDLPNFSAIHYAYPTSFVVMNESRYEALPDALRRQVDAAAADAGRQQWALLPSRIWDNYSRMRYGGIFVSTSLDDGLQVRLRHAGRARVDEWLSRVPSDDREIIKAFETTKPPAGNDACSMHYFEATNGARG